MPNIKVAAAIILENNKVLIAQRPLDKHKGGYWEFPGGKIEAGESAEQALAREIFEEINLHIESPEEFQRIEFDYPEKSVSLIFFKVEKYSGEPHGREGQPVEWVDIDVISQYQFPEANLPVVERLIEWNKSQN